MELCHFLYLVGYLVLIVGFVLGELQAFLLLVDDLAILILQLFQSVNLLVDFVSNHILDVLEQRVNAILSIIKVDAGSVFHVSQNAAVRIYILNSLRIALLGKVKHSKLCVDGTPLNLSQVGRCVQQIIQRNNVVLLQSHTQTLHISGGAFQSHLISLSFDNTVDHFLIDGQKPVFVFEVSHVFDAKFGDFLEGIDGDKTTICRVFLGSLLERVENVLNRINRVACRINNIREIVDNFLLNILNSVFVFPPLI